MATRDSKGSISTLSRQELDRLSARLRAGHAEAVVKEATRLAALHSRSVPLLVLLGAAHMQLKRFDAAANAFSSAAAIEPRNPVALNNLGIAFKELGRDDDAIKVLQRAIAARPDFAQAHYNLGNALRKTGKGADAIAAYRKALAIQPDNAQARYNLGLALYDLEKFEEAAQAWEEVVGAAPRHDMAHVNLGNALLDLGRPQEALPCYRRALELQPGNALAQYNLGRTLEETGEYDEAAAAYRQALSLNGSMISAHFNLGLLELRRGNFETGLREYEWRKRKPDAVSDDRFAAPLWQGRENLREHSIYLHAEQGLGDTIQFLRYVPLVHELGAQVTLGVQPGLVPLVKQSIPGVTVVGQDNPPPTTDFHCHLLSLPLAFGTRVDSIPSPHSYLAADPDRVRLWRERLGEQDFRIGICWQGSTLKIDKGRSFPLTCFEGIAQLPGVRLISLHKGAGEAQLQDLPQGMTVETLGPEFDPPGEAFADSSAVMMHCDLVITSDTAVAHLAGALGRPVWVALKHVPDWRWMLDRSDSPWYPSMRLFRQTEAGDWRGPFGQMEQALMDLLAGRRVLDESSAPVDSTPMVPVSWGEVIDKVTILEIKEERITQPTALLNVHRELAALRAVIDEDLSPNAQLAAHGDELREINRQLWEIEVRIRAKERDGCFDAEFIELARAVYRTNDRRSAIKRAINQATGSTIIEEKSY